MNEKKSIKSIFIAIYFVIIGILFFVHFMALIKIQPYIERGAYGRIHSVLEDAFSMENVEKYLNEIEHKSKMEKLTKDVVMITTRNSEKISSILSYQKVVLSMGALFYILSGLCILKQSKKCKGLFCLGVLAWATWLSMFRAIPNIVIKISNDIMLALNEYWGKSVEPISSANIGMDVQGVLYILFTFIFCVALPGYLIYRVKIITKENLQENI